MRHGSRSINAAPRLGFLYRLGACRKCMRQSFECALLLTVSYVITAFAFSGMIEPVALHALLVLAVAATLLWAAHFIVFAIRETIERTRRGHAARLAMAPSRPAPAHARRSAIALFLKLAAGAAVATAVPRFAFAWGECAGQRNCGPSTCAPGGGVYCCPKPYPFLNLCNCRCYETLEGLMQTGCNATGSCFDEDF